MDTTQRAALELGSALEAMSGWVSSEEAVREFARMELGFDVPEALTSLGVDPAVLDAAVAALDALDALSDEDADEATVALRAAELAAAVAAASLDMAGAGSRAAAGLDPAFVAATDFTRALPRRLLDWLVVNQIENRSTAALEALRVLGVVQLDEVEADPATFTTPHVRRALALDPLVALVTDPAGWLRAAHGWGTDRSALEPLVERLFYLGVSLGVPAELSWADLQRAHALAPAFDPDADAAPPELRLPLLGEETTTSGVEAGLGLLVLPAGGGLGEGLALLPFAAGALEQATDLDLLRTWQLQVRSTLDLAAGVGVVARPGQALRAVTDIDGAGAAAAGVIEARLARAATADPVALLTLPHDAGLFATGVEVRVAALLDAQQPAELTFEAALKAARLRVHVDDELLGAMIPDFDATFDAGLGFSTRRGAYLVGSATLAITRTLDQRAGPVAVRALRLAIRPPPDGAPAGLQVLAGLDVSFALGPVTALVTGVGADLRLTERAGGNLGPVDLDLGFKAPDGIGLAISAGPVTGSGQLLHDAARGLWAGQMALEFEGISAGAVGLLSSGGPAGVSLLVLISTRFTPVPLGLGFTLEGIGGLLAVNRTVAVDALRAGLRTGALGAVLSPPDPEGSIAELAATLDGLFPPAAGRFVFGPTARIGWGNPTLITIDLCLAVELPDPVRVVVLGRLRAVLPDEHAAVVLLQTDLLGVVDLDRREAAVDATLVDSRLAQFALTGDMALRMSWGAQPGFLLAVGGFNPGFAAPAGFPALERVAVSLAEGDNPKLRLEAYLALTSNTVQVGARVDLLARAGRFSVGGFLSFDALITLAPLTFTVDVAAKLAVKAGKRTLLSVTLALTLSGPQPWRARGRASFSILFLDVSFGFDVTIGDGAPPAVAAPVDVAALLLAALADRRAWSAQLPAGGAALAVLRPVQAGADVLAHPLGRLEVRQRVAPLERPLERFGTSVPSGAPVFRMPRATIDGAPAEVTGLTDLFAPAQFTDLSDEEKLSAPSFEAMASGVAIGATAVAHGAPVSVGLVYEQKLVTAPGVPEKPPERGPLPADVMAVLTATPVAVPPRFAVVGA